MKRKTKQHSKAVHVEISDIVMDARAKAFNAVVALMAKDPDATVDTTLTLFREAWQEATPGEGAIRLPSDSAVEDLARGTGPELRQPQVPGEHAALWDRLVAAIEKSMALTEAETEQLVENLIPAILSTDEKAQERADALSCTLSQIRGIVEIAIDTIEEHADCTVGTRMCDATAALYGAVALAKVRYDETDMRANSRPERRP
jgi:hypothetical protein